MTKLDLHIHGAPWSNGWAQYRRSVWNGWKRGLKHIGICEHAPRMNHRVPWRALYFSELDRYFDTMEEIRMEFSGAAETLIGLEVDYHQGMVERYREILPRLPLDYVVGAIHTVKDWVVDLPDSISESSLLGMDAEGLYREYFTALREAARSGLFDYIAHPDFIKKALPHLNLSKPPQTERIYRETAETLAACKVGIEINTRGLILPDVGEYYPEEAFLRECARAGVPVTIGSDAHITDRVGDGVEGAVEYAYAAGYREICIWRKRELIALPI